MVERHGRRLVWRGQGEPRARAPGTICEASFEVEIRSRARHEAIGTEMHRQRHFPEAEVLAALERAGLECLEVFGHGDDAIPKQPLDDWSTTRPST